MSDERVQQTDMGPTAATPHVATSSCTACNQSWHGWYCATCNRTVESYISSDASKVHSERTCADDPGIDFPADTPAIPIERTHRLILLSRIERTRNTSDSTSSETSEASKPSESTKRMRRKLSPNTSSSEDRQTSSSELSSSTRSSDSTAEAKRSRLLTGGIEYDDV